MHLRSMNVLWTFNHTVDVMAVCMVLLSDDKHGELGTVTLKACVKALGVKDVGEVAEVLLGKRVRDPLPIDHLALSERNVHRVGDPVNNVVRLAFGGCKYSLTCCFHYDMHLCARFDREWQRSRKIKKF
jgi:hypothetical protein